MKYQILRTLKAEQIYQDLEKRARASLEKRSADEQAGASPAEGLLQQIYKTIELSGQNPRHPGLKTHEYDALTNPYSSKEKVFEAYAQNNTPGAYRVFWCYGPKKGRITILAITSHP